MTARVEGADALAGSALAEVERGAGALDLDSPASVTMPPAGERDEWGGDDFALAIRGATKRWRKGQAPVLDGLELTLDPGSKTWVGGPNGAGKTTMLRIAAGLIDPDGGSVEVWGVSPRGNRARYQQLVSF
ncbi:MAG TPA: ATP-binding cassette domain-containing protein, partial [Solirubrobacteraceae bacterium]|nr:ATP-binding cassette domain-containing protein [Solirubrobacteraceae bacterium]